MAGFPQSVDGGEDVSHNGDQLRVGAIGRTEKVSEFAPTQPCSGRAELAPCGQRGDASVLEPKGRGAKFCRLIKVRSCESVRHLTPDRRRSVNPPNPP
jgi:hypothetical protein